MVSPCRSAFQYVAGVMIEIKTMIDVLCIRRQVIAGRSSVDLTWEDDSRP